MRTSANSAIGRQVSLNSLTAVNQNPKLVSLNAEVIVSRALSQKLCQKATEVKIASVASRLIIPL